VEFKSEVIVVASAPMVVWILMRESCQCNAALYMYRTSCDWLSWNLV